MSNGYTLSLWENLVESHMRFLTAERDFFAANADRVTLVRKGLKRGDVPTVAHVAPYLSTTEKQALFPEWVLWAISSQGYVSVFRGIIQSLPREWVLSRIQAVVEPMLAQATYDDYQLVFGLYYGLDSQLTRSLAQRALISDDQEIREAGLQFLESLDEE